ncbi:MAG: sugar transferase [Phycisphaerales bacterium]|nr:MAG: sugar transferase [Phycisphaerales bacterium]
MSGRTPMVWGLDALELHDRFWASHGVQVVRRGDNRTSDHRSATFLLLEPEDLVIFDLCLAAGWLRRRNRLVRVLLLESDAPPYSEQVVAAEFNRLVALRRRYAPKPRSELPVLLSNRSELASLWRESADRPAGERALRLAAGLHQHREISQPGQLFSAADPEQMQRFLAALMSVWTCVDSVCPDVITRRPGVWVHRSANLAPDVRFVPPVWIGAGVTLGRGDIVIGPCIINDETRIAPPRAPGTHPALRPVPDRAVRGSDLPPAPVGVVERRLFDIVFSIAVLVLVAPLFPAIMLAIWLEDGRPFFFRHTRQTVGGREFICYKFRTMCKNADRLKASLSRSNICDGPQFHIEDDPRLLRVGRFLRRFHLDELPQFFNVLMGHMNVIGPRPSPDDENQFCPAWREARLSVRPGLTGLWQVNRTRAPNTDFQEWIRYDLDYVHRRSLWLDLWIIYETTKSMILPKRRVNGDGRQRNGQRRVVTPAAPAGPPESFRFNTPLRSSTTSIGDDPASEVCCRSNRRSRAAA